SRLRCGALSRELSGTEYGPADDAVGQQVIELYYQLGDYPDTSARGLRGGYQSRDAQFPATASGIADAGGYQKRRVNDPAVCMPDRRGKQDLGNRRHSTEEWGQVNVPYF